MTEMFYYIQLKTQYQKLIGEYNLLIETYRELIVNNEEFTNMDNNKSQNINYEDIIKDNILFHQMINDYTRIVSGLQTYISLLDVKIKEFD